MLALFVVGCASACHHAHSTTPPTQTPDSPTSPTRFGPGVISTADPEFGFAITADGTTIYFNRLDASRTQFELLTAERRGAGWSKPEPVWFAAPPARDIDPFLTYDGRELVFSSNRPRPGSASSDFNFWRVAVQRGAPPTLLPATINSEAMEVFGGFDRAGRFAFARSIGDATRVLDVDTLDAIPRDVAPSVTTSLTNPILSPDGRLLIVASTELVGHGAADLFVLHRDGDAWSEPYNLGSHVNSPYPEFAPAFSPDQRTLYFTSERLGEVSVGLPSERRPGDLYAISTTGIEAFVLPVCKLGPINAHAMASIGQRVFAFAGADTSRVRSDLRELAGVTWRNVRAASEPSARTFAVLVSRARDVVLFGGSPVLFGPTPAPALLSDTWTFDGVSWKSHQVAGPSARSEAAAAFDRRRGRVVMFGGYAYAQEAVVPLDDLWEWDGERWHAVVPNDGPRPGPRHGAAMAYDEERGAIVMFGGSTGGGRVSGETWTWNGERWQLVNATAAVRYGAVAAWDPERAQVIRFGGWNGERRVGDTWAWIGERWQTIAFDGPSARNHTAIAAPPGGLVLVGGHDGKHVFGDAWRWQRGRWVPLCAAAPRARIANDH
ncbi:MAG: hypothetical protein ACKV2T_22145 [Kofleriaceae bacterium]